MKANEMIFYGLAYMLILGITEFYFKYTVSPMSLAFGVFFIGIVKKWWEYVKKK